MTYLGVDRGAKFDAPTAACLKGKGNAFVVRYLDDSFGLSAKSITEAEAQIILASGLSIFLVFESTGGAAGFDPSGAAYFTRDRGISDAQHAVSQARSVGYPSGMPIFFAVDFDANMYDLSRMVEYFNGIYDIFSGPQGTNESYAIGIYGSYGVVNYAKTNWPAVTFWWQTYAWSAGLWLAEAQIKQVQNGVVSCGVEVDFNESTILGWTMADTVTRAEFEAYKTALQKQLDDFYMRKGDAPTTHQHSGTVTVQ